MTKECIAMVLAGGKGTRLGALTRNLAKPAIPYGGKYKIIDFTLSNCINSGIDTVGVLTQYEPLALNEHLKDGRVWDLDRRNGGLSILPPYTKDVGTDWYKGTANAIYQNIQFIERYSPRYVMVLSGDHIYKMDYSQMLKYHKEKKADVTVAVMEVPLNEADRFGILNTTENNRIYEFEEKPKAPKSTKASMGVYIFNWEILKYYLVKDEYNKNSAHDFGKDVIPLMLEQGLEMFAYPFTGYWKDVGTVESFFEANMDLLDSNCKMNLFDRSWQIFSKNEHRPPQYVGEKAKINRSLISEGCVIHGEVYNSIIFSDVYIGKGSVVSNSIILPNAIIHDKVSIDRAIILNDVNILNNIKITGSNSKISLIGDEELCLLAQ